MLKGVNKIIKILIYSDFILNGAWGFVSPFFAIFIMQKITFGNPAKAAEVAGIAAFVYWIFKSILQIPLSKGFDKRMGERDDYWFMIFGLLVASIAPFGFLMATSPWHIYLFQLVHAAGMAMFIPSWNAIFTRHMDKNKAAFEWGIDSTFLGFSIGITGAIGGLMVALIGFKMIFILAGILTLGSALLLLLIHKNILPRDSLIPRLPFVRHRDL